VRAFLSAGFIPVAAEALLVAPQPRDHRSMFEPLIRRAGLPPEASIADVLNAVRQMPYRRPASRTIAGTLAEWCGTCSTKPNLRDLDVAGTVLTGDDASGAVRGVPG
jgi:hypothetical protein